MHYVYILESLKTGGRYIGETKDLRERLKRHNQGRSKFTRGKAPWKVLVYCVVKDKSEAVKLERKLKSLKNSEKAIEYLRHHCSVVEHSDF